MTKPKNPPPSPNNLPKRLTIATDAHSAGVVIPVNARLKRPPNRPAKHGGGQWSPSAARWWREWATSPQATMFAGTEWQRLAMLMPFVDRLYTSEGSDPRLLAEIRRCEQDLGATGADRKRLGYRLGEAEEPATPATLSIVDPRYKDTKKGRRNATG